MDIHDLNVSQIDVGSFSKPLLNDMDGDEDLDLLIGNSKGLIIYYENQGDKRTAFCSAQYTYFRYSNGR
ncbi:MAG: hypothetical protein CM1200mP28_06480 [Deltaproteobacteria bacterium]|nr:MAG: hypothetical protein CM1200mP28_06480 [Deltaproteobacteria bacterium]